MFTITSTENTTVNTPIQIVIGPVTAGGAVMYAVPAGRKFIGRIGNITSGYSTLINGAAISFFNGNSTSVATAGSLAELTLLAGTVIKEVNGTNSYIYGVESDA